MKISRLRTVFNIRCGIMLAYSSSIVIHRQVVSAFEKNARSSRDSWLPGCVNCAVKPNMLCRPNRFVGIYRFRKRNSVAGMRQEQRYDMRIPARRIKIAGNIQPSTDERGPHLLSYAIKKYLLSRIAKSWRPWVPHLREE
jgi:hypothetical protein